MTLRYLSESDEDFDDSLMAHFGSSNAGTWYWCVCMIVVSLVTVLNCYHVEMVRRRHDLKLSTHNIRYDFFDKIFLLAGSGLLGVAGTCFVFFC